MPILQNLPTFEFQNLISLPTLCKKEHAGSEISATVLVVDYS
jgi:hypothetical protein